MNVCMYAHLKFYECARVVKNEYVTYYLRYLPVSAKNFSQQFQVLKVYVLKLTVQIAVQK